MSISCSRIRRARTRRKREDLICPHSFIPPPLGSIEVLLVLLLRSEDLCRGRRRRDVFVVIRQDYKLTVKAEDKVPVERIARLTLAWKGQDVMLLRGRGDGDKPGMRWRSPRCK